MNELAIARARTPELVQEKTVRVGRMPGRIEDTTLTEGTTVADALERAGLQALLEDGYELRVNGEDAGTDTALENGDTVLLIRKIQGNNSVVNLEDFAAENPAAARAYEVVMSLPPGERANFMINLAVGLIGPAPEGERAKVLDMMLKAMKQAVEEMIPMLDKIIASGEHDIEPCVLCGKKAPVRISEGGGRTTPICITCRTDRNISKQAGNA